MKFEEFRFLELLRKLEVLLRSIFVWFHELESRFLISFFGIKVIARSTSPLVSIINFSAFRVIFISWKPPKDLDQMLAFAAKSKSQETRND